MKWKSYSIDFDVGSSEFIVKNRYTAISAGTEFQYTQAQTPKCTSQIRGAIIRTSRVMPDWVRSSQPVRKSISSLAISFFIMPTTRLTTSCTDGYSHYANISEDLFLPEVSLVRFAAIVLSGSIRLSKIELGDKIALIGLGIIGQIASHYSVLRVEM